MRVQPSADTSIKFVHNTAEPSLVIQDGTTSLVFSPADFVGGLAETAEFAEELVQGASEWESGCRRRLAAQSGDPCDVDILLATHGRPQPGDGDRA
jgi:hypothetical protein